MTVQEKREKVIEGLEFTLEEAGWDANAAYDQELMIQAVTDAIAMLKAQEPEAATNPVPQDDSIDWATLMRRYTPEQVEAAMKAQEPRVMTPEDFENNPDADIEGCLPCWYEYKHMHNMDGWGTCSKVNHGVTEKYARRQWTSRPNDAQREATPWL